MGDWTDYYASQQPQPPQPPSPYKDNGELKVMTVKYYLECRNLLKAWNAAIPASVKKAYKDKGLKL